MAQSPWCVQISPVKTLPSSLQNHPLKAVAVSDAKQRCLTTSPPQSRWLKIITYSCSCIRSSQVSLTPRDGGSQGVLSWRWQKYKGGEQKHTERPRASARDGPSVTPGRSHRPNKAWGRAFSGKGPVTWPRAWGMRNKHVTYHRLD